MNNIRDLTSQTTNMMKMLHPGKRNGDFKEGVKLLEMETSSESDQEHFVLPPSTKGSRKRYFHRKLV